MEGQRIPVRHQHMSSGSSLLSCRLRTEFKKGYPHGPASLELISGGGQPMWRGEFTNGVISGDNMEPDLRNFIL